MIDLSIRGGIAHIVWNHPSKSQNLINDESCAAYFEVIERVCTDPTISGVLMSSAKSDFIAGGDLQWLLQATDPALMQQRSKDWHRAQRRLETCGKPVAVAISGSALGGGLEVALAAHYRVGTTDPKARFGLPEATLGLLPGGGGTQRMLRMVGAVAALPLLLEGKKLRAAEALQHGLLNAAVEPGQEVDAALAWLQSDKAHAQQPWDRKDFKLPGGSMSSPGVVQALTVANAMLRKRAQGLQPQLLDILSCVVHGGPCDIDTGLAVEARFFAHTVVQPACKAMIRTLFFGMQAANKPAALSAGPQPTPKAQRVGVLGAGMMGAGIAYAAAKAGLPVVLLDATLEQAQRGKAYSEQLLAKQLARGDDAARQAQALLARIQPSAEYTDLTGSDLVVEAVFEDRALKARVTAQTEALTTADTVFATNTSTLPITGLAEASKRPEQFIGLHFFSPVDKMPLVEVIMGQQTSAATLARALAFVRQLGKTPIVVNDSRGFYTSRVFSTYVLEGLALLAEGVAPALIENAGLQVGMPVGPLALTDEVSSELIARIDRQTQIDLGADYRAHPGHIVARQMVEWGRIGRKSGKGFYDYPADAAKQLWAGLGERYAVRPDQPDVQDVVERLLMAQCIEAVRCLEEGVLHSALDGDVGAVLGWGFPAARGGPFGEIHSQGVNRVVQRCEQLCRQHGARFAPPQRLVQMQQRGEAFYPH
ncbi:3-hydroxyacyl-CoA dehydrogenase NAD-binding domain-containing protein [Roseateles sp. BYS180W]|uniref:3-hydroxyacyl-CoA dehydrogenase NAD-binding domain-containing protein n=1 Tax=Roseateles rivi TaxID=3299028 RepID=A0ABW7FX22_9BURK